MLAVLVLSEPYASGADGGVAAQVMGACACSSVVASARHAVIYAPVALYPVKLVAESCSGGWVCVSSQSIGAVRGVVSVSTCDAIDAWLRLMLSVFMLC
jgi:hypothetical protein